MQRRKGRSTMTVATCLCFLLLDTTNGQQQQERSSYDCDFLRDTCRKDWQMDGECDNQDARFGCWQTDCFDCDPCLALSFTSRETCLDKGCVWCPGDALCLSQPVNDTVWNKTGVESSCRRTKDWTTTTHNSHDDSNDDKVNNSTISYNLTTNYSTNCSNDSIMNVFTDPLYDSMAWSYRLIHVEDVWKQGTTGKGVRIRINDDGVDASHLEFQKKFDTEHSCDEHLPPNNKDHPHGTAVASIVAGGADNDLCAVGIAPDAHLSACLHTNRYTRGAFADMFLTHWEHVDISINAWGVDACPLLATESRPSAASVSSSSSCPFLSDPPTSPCAVCRGSDNNSNSSRIFQVATPTCKRAIVRYCGTDYAKDVVACTEYLDLMVDCKYNAISQPEQDALAKGIHYGRGGRGTIYVFAAGNEYGRGEDVNMEGFLHSRFTITVAAVDKHGKHASYSTTGAALFISAPGGDVVSLTNNLVAAPGGGCQDIEYGTSLACPVLAGVVALLLEVNPNLGWRDVQGILAATSQQVDPTDDSWTVNAAGFHHSYKYGFGLADAASAVEAAKSWEIWDQEQQIVRQPGTVNVPIVDDKDIATKSTIVLEESLPDDFVVESVVIYLDLVHASRGDLEVVLTSPKGTPSLLHPSPRPENTQYASYRQRWKLMTVRAWGEPPQGNWTLSLKDLRPGNLQEGCVDMDLNGIATSITKDGKKALSASSMYLGWSCEDLEAYGDCIDGNAYSDLATQFVADNITSADACCACGGGFRTTPASSANRHTLRSWTLVVYGRGSIVEEADDSSNTAADPKASGSRAAYGFNVAFSVLAVLLA